MAAIVIPDPDSRWSCIEIFSLNFNAYERMGSNNEAFAIGDRVERDFEGTGAFPCWVGYR